MTKKNAVPAYLLHQATGKARVRIDGKDYYLGEYGTDASRQQYGELIAKHCAGLPIDPFAAGSSTSKGPSVAELLLAFKTHAESYYVKNGKRTAEVDCFYSVIRVARELYSATPVKLFSPQSLKACRTKFVENGWTRSFCNKSTNRLRQIFKWGVENGMVAVTVWQALKAVEPLKAGKTVAPDRKRRKAIPLETQEAAREKLCAEDQRFFDLLRYSGARPSELLGLTMADVDQTGDVWTAKLADHKCVHLDKDRTLYFGPRCQEVLKQCPQQGRMFKFRRSRFSDRLKKACTDAGIEPFVPYVLRHTAATMARDQISVEASQGLLGHSKPDMTAKYSRKMDTLAKKAAAAIG